MGINSVIAVDGNNEVPSIDTINEFEEFLTSYIKPTDRVALLMDFDGTLAPITANPNNTYMPRKTSDLFKRLCYNNHIFPAVISGRGIVDVKSRVGVNNITYAGCHGLEIEYTNGHRYDHYIPIEIKNNFPIMYEELRKFENDKRIWVENKKTSLTVHYHTIPEEEHLNLFNKINEIITKYGYVAHKAHGAVDIKPPVCWNKGKAAEQILTRNFGDDWMEKVKVVFAGDDVTDEDAMEVLKGKAVTFRVSQNPKISTNASFRLASPEQVYLMLSWLEQQFQ